MAITDAQQALRAPARPVWHPVEAWLAVVGALVCLGSVGLAAAGSPPDAAFGRGLLELLIVGGPIAIGLYAVRTPANRSFGAALLGIGFTWSLTALAESTLSVPYTIGRLATWLTFPCVVYLLLAFPHGRIAAGLDRAVFLGVVGVILLLFFGTAPFVQAFPPKTLWSTCTTDCPANALFVLHAQPAALAKVILVREWLIELLWLGLFASMLRRWRAASPLQRQALGPAFLAGTLLGLFHYAHITARQLGAPTDTVIALSSAWTLCIVAVCAGFLFGLLRRRMFLTGAQTRLGAALNSSDDPGHMRDAVAAALGDPTAELLFRDRDSEVWHDARGHVVPRPGTPAADRAVTVIDAHDGRVAAALVHDVALLHDRELLDGVSGIVRAGRRHERLMADLTRAMRELDDSRRRLAEAADHERARIERDLHDGAQQRLVALRLRLGLAEELLRTDPRAGVQEVHELGFEAERAIDELRSLAHGVDPPLLAGRGLGDALRSVAAQAPMPVEVVAAGVARHSIEVETAVYFTCVEALQNALKHARGATRVTIELSQTATRLSFDVRDDGPGFSPQDHNGRGLRNMCDRVEAAGGELAVVPRPGHGTRVVGSVPLP